MQTTPPHFRLTSDLHFMAGSVLLFAFGEQLLHDFIVGSDYLSSNLFYLPSIILSGLVALGVYGTLWLTFQMMGLLRPRFAAQSAMMAMALPVSLYLFAYSMPSLPVSAISGIYGGRIVGQVLSLSTVALTTALFGFQLIVMLKSRSSTKPRWLGRYGLLASVIGIGVAGLSHRSLFDSYASLNLILLWALALPSILGMALYRTISSGNLMKVDRGSRAWFLLGSAIALISLWRQYAPDSPAGWMFVLLMVLITGSSYSVLMRWGGRWGALIAPGATMILFILLPVLELSWRMNETSESEPARHVILISVDTLRRDALSAYNVEAKPTPNIDALLNDGALFTQAWATSSWTLPSLASIQTAVPPLIHQAISPFSKLSSGLETMAEQFRERGYRTEAIVFNPLLIPDRGFDQGFDRYLFFPEFGKMRNLGQRLVRKLDYDRFEPVGSVSGMSQLAGLRLLRNREKPTFLWLHLWDPHPPYFPPAHYWPEHLPLGEDFTPARNTDIPSPDRQEAAIALYLAEVQYVDDCIGKLRDLLIEAGLYDEATIVFTSDHGEEFWEKDRWGHGNEPTDTQVIVPLMIKPPRSPRGVRVDRLTSTFEIGPMLMDLIDATTPSTGNQPPDLTSLILNRPHPQEQPKGIYTSSNISPDLYTEAIVFGDAPYKYFYDRIAGAEQLYNLGTDPAELRSLVSENTEALALGRKLYQEHLEFGERESALIEFEPDIELPDEIVDELKTHGYLK